VHVASATRLGSAFLLVQTHLVRVMSLRSSREQSLNYSRLAFADGRYQCQPTRLRGRKESVCWRAKNVEGKCKNRGQLLTLLSARAPARMRQSTISGRSLLPVRINVSAVSLS
jgi:hypothetical protein